MFKSIFKKQVNIDSNNINNNESKSTNSNISISYTSNQEDVYEITFSDNMDGNLILEYHEIKGYIYIKNILKSSNDSILKKICKIGDVLLSVNDHIVIDEEFSDILTYLDMLKAGSLPRKLAFLNISKCSFSNYMESSFIAHRNKKDMFGFNRTLDYLLAERNFIATNGEMHTQRDLEWIDFLKSIGGPRNIKPAGVYKPSKDLKQMVRRGIPVAFRPLVWQKISLSSYHRLDFPKGYYNSLLARESDLEFRVRDDIEKDIDRTFPEHEYFSGRGNGESCLRRILIAYAVHNPDVGYCQSLNFVGGMMLLFMEEEDAFWLLLTVVETLLPKDYYTRTMIGTYTDQYVLNHLVKEHLPELHHAIEEAQLQLPLVTVQWFMCIYVNTLRPEIALRVWDIFLNEGSKVLFRIAISLFKLNENFLLSAKDSGELFVRLRDIGRDIVDPDHLIGYAYKSYKPMSLPNRNSVDLPRDLIGFGLAHTGPMRNETLDITVDSAIEQMISQDFTDECSTSATSVIDDSSETVETPVETTIDQLDKLDIVNDNQTADIKSSIEKLKLKCITTVVNADGTDYTVLISDYSKPKDKLKDKLAQSPKSVSNNSKSDNYRRFKRKDIELWREKYRLEVFNQVTEMERNRQIWRQEQLDKQDNDVNIESL